MTCYLDTNIFIYSVTPDSMYYDDCVQLINNKQRTYSITTSLETIQEIMYFTVRNHQPEIGLGLSHLILKSVTTLPVTGSIIETYLDLYQRYTTVDSRDVLHVSTCIEHSIKNLITYDKGLSQFKETKAMTPTQFLKIL